MQIYSLELWSKWFAKFLKGLECNSSHYNDLKKTGNNDQKKGGKCQENSIVMRNESVSHRE